MPVASMTGFGRGHAAGAEWAVDVEISTVNRKQYDCSVTMPRAFMPALEARIQNRVRASLARGSIRAGITITPVAADGAAAPLDLNLARQRVAALRQAAAELHLPDDLGAAALLALDGLFPAGTTAGDTEALWAVLETALAEALDGVVEMRRREGASIAADIRGRLRGLETLAAEIRGRAPEVPKQYAEALRRRIAELGVADVDETALAREVAFFADRCDISEEQTRLQSHFEQAETLLSGDTACGRALDFLCQEFFREINTTGSKANDIEITRRVIAFKTGLEAIREQVQNLE